MNRIQDNMCVLKNKCLKELIVEQPFYFMFKEITFCTSSLTNKKQKHDYIFTCIYTFVCTNQIQLKKCIS